MQSTLVPIRPRPATSATGKARGLTSAAKANEFVILPLSFILIAGSPHKPGGAASNSLLPLRACFIPSDGNIVKLARPTSSPRFRDDPLQAPEQHRGVRAGRRQRPTVRRKRHMKNAALAALQPPHLAECRD